MADNDISWALVPFIAAAMMSGNEIQDTIPPEMVEKAKELIQKYKEQSNDYV